MYWPFRNKKTPTDKVAATDELLKEFRANPGNFLRQFGSKQYDWPESKL